MTENFFSDFDKKFRDEYRKGTGHCAPTNPAHQFDETPPADGKSITPAAVAIPRQENNEALKLMHEVSGATQAMVFGNPIMDYINTLLPNGVNTGSRHNQMLKLASDLLILQDADAEKVRQTLLSLKWVQDVVAERGMEELEHVIDSAKKRLHKRESENLNEPQPSKEMRRAIEQVCNRKYSDLVREAHYAALGNKGGDQENDVARLLDRIGRELEKLARSYPTMQQLFKRLNRKHHIAALLVCAAFSMTLMTRCWYKFWSAPGRICRLNSLLALIGRMGSGKHIAVDLYKVLMEPVMKADAAQVAALNRWNEEREQNSGANKNKTPRPTAPYRCLPAETSAAGAREAECNAHELLDGQEFPLHVSIFDSELDNTLRQMKKSYMEALLTLWLKCFHNEPHGSFLKTSSAKVGEYDVHFNGCYTGTDDALAKLATESNFVNGLLSRFTVVPMGDTNFKMMENRDYDEEDAQRDSYLRDYAYRLDQTKGEIPCKEISDALHKWTARRMADADEDKSFAEEDLVKRPCWHAINYALPFIVDRHWDKMVEDNGRWKCGPDFKVDKTDVKLALLIADAQLAFQEHYFKALGERYYDNRDSERASNVKHQRKTLLAFRRLPDVFTSEDVDKAYGYHGTTGSIYSRLKRLQDDGLIQKIRTGEDKGKYRKLV